LRNSRFPEMLEGDTRAMLASCQLGERRLQEIFRRFGTDVVLTAFREQLSRSEDVARRVFLSQVAPGKHTFRGFIDGDGRSNRTYKVQLDLIRAGDWVIADFRESDDQAEGPINFIASLGVVQLMFARFVMAAEPSLPLNEGTLRVIDELRTRPGSILAPQFPAAVGVRAHAKQKTNSTVLGALATATGGQTPASSATYVLVYLRARDPKTGAAVLYVDGIGVGTGGRPFANGLDVIYSNNQKNYPAEFVDSSFPLRLERYAVHVDSGGPGKHRGGCGCVRDIRILSDGATLATRMDNARFPAWGVNGGRAGRRGRITVNPGSSDEREIESLRDGNKLREGDLLRVETAGGGGWGDPLERDPWLVASDVANGFVSEKAALADYGLVIDPVSLAIDEAATAAERRRQARPWQLFDLGAAEA
ncbi:MAG: hydantoinase B/oxoprolinase family protein, partial [Chloroflexi bacterium]|nr:hydantoinase B/oxoprolinase family protein [Chloroflexota bacterium]